LLAALICHAPVWAQQASSFPNKPLRIIVPYPPGGAVDPLARTLGQKLTEAWGQPVVIDNKPGAGTVIGTQLLAKSPPDGHTILFASSNHAVNPAMYEKLPYDSVKDFVPITLVALFPLMLTVNPDVPAKNVTELIALLKKQPGRFNFSTAGNGGATHLAGELFKSMAGVFAVHVPYRGSGPSVMSVMAGESQMTFDTVFLQMPQVREGKLRALAVTTSKRSQLATEIPTMAEAGLPGYEAYTWVGALAPAGTPPDIVLKWQQEIARILQMPDIRSRQIAAGLEPVGNTPEQFTQFMRTEMDKWAKVVKRAGIKAD
jgi:hypothetical protein